MRTQDDKVSSPAFCFFEDHWPRRTRHQNSIDCDRLVDFQLVQRLIDNIFTLLPECGIQLLEIIKWQRPALRTRWCLNLECSEYLYRRPLRPRPTSNLGDRLIAARRTINR